MFCKEQEVIKLFQIFHILQSASYQENSLQTNWALIIDSSVNYYLIIFRINCSVNET